MDAVFNILYDLFNRFAPQNMQRLLKERIIKSIEDDGYDIVKRRDNNSLSVLLETLLQVKDSGKARTEDELKEKGKVFSSALEALVVPEHLAFSWGDRLLTLDKSFALLNEDAKFINLFSEINGKYKYDQYDGSDGIAWRLNTLVWGARAAMEIEGDFVECGVFRGDMSYIVCQMLDFESLDRQFYLYDTFSGFDPAYSSAEDYPDNPNFFNYVHDIYNEESLETRVRNRFDGYSNVNVIKGTVPESLSDSAPEKISFLHIDLNSPKAEVGALEKLFDRVQSGGVIIFDDYGWTVFRKQRIAEDAFMARHNYKILELPTGQGLVIKR